jgi:hypothetical protein
MIAQHYIVQSAKATKETLFTWFPMKAGTMPRGPGLPASYDHAISFLKADVSSITITCLASVHMGKIDTYMCAWVYDPCTDTRTEKRAARNMTGRRKAEATPKPSFIFKVT